LEEDEIDRSHIQLEKDIKQQSEKLEEIEEETIEEFLNHMKDLEQQEDMMVETSSGTTGSYVSKNDSLFVNAGQMHKNINANDGTRIALGESKHSRD